MSSQLDEETNDSGGSLKVITGGLELGELLAVLPFPPHIPTFIPSRMFLEHSMGCMRLYNDSIVLPKLFSDVRYLMKLCLKRVPRSLDV